VPTSSAPEPMMTIPRIQYWSRAEEVTSMRPSGMNIRPRATNRKAARSPRESVSHKAGTTGGGPSRESAPLIAEKALRITLNCSEPMQMIERQPLRPPAGSSLRCRPRRATTLVRPSQSCLSTRIRFVVTTMRRLDHGRVERSVARKLC
jgi:hypothetical protein